MPHSRRLLTLGPSDEPLWVRLYIQPLGDQWAAMIVADSAEAPKPGELKGTSFFGDTPAEAWGRFLCITQSVKVITLPQLRFTS